MPSEPMTKRFHLGAILSVTTGVLVTEIGDVYEIENHMTGDSISTIGLLSATPPCRAALLQQFPQLASVDASGVNGETWRSWLSEQVARFGAMHNVVPMGRWEKRSVADDILDAYRLNPTAEVMVLEDDHAS